MIGQRNNNNNRQNKAGASYWAGDGRVGGGYTAYGVRYPPAEASSTFQQRAILHAQQTSPHVGGDFQVYNSEMFR